MTKVVEKPVISGLVRPGSLALLHLFAVHFIRLYNVTVKTVELL